MHKVWARAEPSRICKTQHAIFPKELPQPKNDVFVPSYEKDDPVMGLLLSWEYGRVWLKEHNEYLESEISKHKSYFVKPDFNWWLSKRTGILDRRQNFLKKRQNPHVKNCNLTAFAMSKDIREKIKNEENARRKNAKPSDPTGAPNTDNADNVTMTYSEKARRCCCNNCKERRSGGKDTKKPSGTRGRMRIPWY